MQAKIVLVYAKSHWDLGNEPVDGVGLYAKTWYESLVRVFPKHEIIFADFTEARKYRGLKEVDYLFSIPNGMQTFIKAIKPVEANLIAVNEHALLRRRIRRIAKKTGVPKKFLEPHDGVRSFLQETRGVSNVIALGSWNSLKSYEISGFSSKNVFAVGWNYWPKRYEIYSSKSRTRILMYLGSICFRKGVFFVPDILKLLKSKHNGYILNLVGFVNNENLEKWLRNLESEYPENFI